MKWWALINILFILLKKNVGDAAMLALRQVNGVNFQVGHGPEILCKLHVL